MKLEFYPLYTTPTYCKFVMKFAKSYFLKSKIKRNLFHFIVHYKLDDLVIGIPAMLFPVYFPHTKIENNNETQEYNSLFSVYAIGYAGSQTRVISVIRNITKYNIMM